MEGNKLWNYDSDFTVIMPIMLMHTCSCSLFCLLCFLSHAISKGEKKRRRRKRHHHIIIFIWGMSPFHKKKCTLCSNVKFNSVFYSCTNCLANSVLYSRDHKQGFILYCISTHWTIILMRDCKENLLGRIIRTLFVRLLGPSLVGAVKVGSERFFFFQGNCLYNLSEEATVDNMNIRKT